MDRKAVRVMEEMTGMKIEKADEEEKVNVCKAIQGIEERGRIAGLAEGRSAGLAEGRSAGVAEGRAAGRAVGRSEGIQHEQKLTKALLRDNRIDDLKRALEDPDFRQKLLEEYGID